MSYEDIMIKVDMHVHTMYSKDSVLSLEKLFFTCQQKNIECISITDHNTIKGALEFQKRFPLKPARNGVSLGVKIIVGEEIETKAGEIIGLFLKEEIASGLSVGKTIAAIKKQGGFVYLPHPLDRWRKAPVYLKNIDPFWSEIDIIEVFNSRSLISSWNEKALELAREKKKPYGVGSDAHSEKEVGKSLMEMEAFNSPAQFIHNLTSAKIIKSEKTSLISRLFIKSANILGHLK